MLEIPVKVFSFEITSAEQQVFWEMQSSENHRKSVTLDTKSAKPVQQCNNLQLRFQRMPSPYTTAEQKAQAFHNPAWKQSSNTLKALPVRTASVRRLSVIRVFFHLAAKLWLPYTWGHLFVRHFAAPDWPRGRQQQASSFREWPKWGKKTKSHMVTN